VLGELLQILKLLRLRAFRGGSLQIRDKKLQDLKKLAQHYARDQGSCDDVQISYLESLEEHDNDNLRLAQMLAG
jgi:hypothetical protein